MSLGEYPTTMISHGTSQSVVSRPPEDGLRKLGTMIAAASTRKQEENKAITNLVIVE